MADKKALVKNVDMSDEMQADAIEVYFFCPLEIGCLMYFSRLQPLRLGSSELRRMLRLTSSRPSTRSTSRCGTASWEGTSVHS